MFKTCQNNLKSILKTFQNKFQNQNTLIILCGSNIDMRNWAELTRDQ